MSERVRCQHCGAMPIWRKYGPDEIERIRKLASDGLTAAEISERTGAARGVVTNLCRKNRIKLLGRSRYALWGPEEPAVAGRRQGDKRKRRPS